MLDSYKLYLLIVLMLFVSVAAQLMVKKQFNAYSKSRALSGLTGGEVARRILENAGIFNVRIERVSGWLTDHYDPNNLVLRLSPETIDNATIAAIGVAAHEAGHVLQHKDAFGPLMLRTACARSAGIGSQAAWPIFFAGMLLSWEPLLYAGIILYALVVAFTLITLPVELNASSRALAVVAEGGYLAPEELPGARKVLTAAAFTYVASALMAILQLLRLLAIASGGRRRN